MDIGALDSIPQPPRKPKGDKLKQIRPSFLKAQQNKLTNNTAMEPTKKLSWRNKPSLSDSIVKEEDLGSDPKPVLKSKGTQPGQLEGIVNKSELDDEQLDGMGIDDDTGGDVPGMSSGNNYTINNAKSQLDGIIKQWMDLAGNFPEGEKRHNFMEIGERLREISAVLNRDFIEKTNE